MTYEEPQVQPLVLLDADVRAHLTPELAIAGARASVLDAYRGPLVGQPRVFADAGETDFAFTVGGYRGGPLGFRVYARWRPIDYRNQAVLVWHADHTLRAAAFGYELGARRNGALGGVAVDALARRDARTVGMVGTGIQAYCQLWAVAAVREIAEVRAYRRDAEQRRVFASRVEDELELSCRAAASAREAVEGSDIVIISTGAAEPVVDAAWVTPGAHVTTVSMTAQSKETPPELIDRARAVVSDSPEQSLDADPFGLLAGHEVIHLGAVLAGGVPARDPDDITLYWSAGLAGSEVVILDRLADAVDRVAAAR